VVEMYDTWGDGWDTGVYTLTNQQGEVVATGTLASGTYGTDEVCGLVGCYTMAVSEPQWFASESSWKITNRGVVVAEGALPANVNDLCTEGVPSSAPTTTVSPTLTSRPTHENVAYRALSRLYTGRQARTPANTLPPTST